MNGTIQKVCWVLAVGCIAANLALAAPKQSARMDRLVTKKLTELNIQLRLTPILGPLA